MKQQRRVTVVAIVFGFVVYATVLVLVTGLAVTVWFRLSDSAKPVVLD